jgi:hypothetical protein
MWFSVGRVGRHAKFRVSSSLSILDEVSNSSAQKQNICCTAGASTLKPSTNYWQTVADSAVLTVANSDAFQCFCKVLLSLVLHASLEIVNVGAHGRTTLTFFIAHNPAQPVPGPQRWTVRGSVRSHMIWNAEDIRLILWTIGELRDLNNRAWDGEKGK